MTLSVVIEDFEGRSASFTLVSKLKFRDALLCESREEAFVGGIVHNSSLSSLCSESGRRELGAFETLGLCIGGYDHNERGGDWPERATALSRNSFV